MSDALGKSVLGQAITEYATLAMEHAALAARNYMLTEPTVIGTDSFGVNVVANYPISKEKSEALGLEQHKLHVRFYESRRRLEGLTESLAGSS